MFKSNEFYVREIIKNLDFIVDHMQNMTIDDFSKNEVLVDSMVFRLIQISELSKNLTEEYKDCNDSIPWSDITALRNRLVHDYGNVDMTIVFNTLSTDIPELKSAMEILL